MGRTEVYIKIAEVISRKEKHLKEYSDRIENLAEYKSAMGFMTGHCEECENYEKEISELEQKLKNDK